MVTCVIRYKLNLKELPAFEEYGKIWIKIIKELGGIHHGYFFPSDDSEIDKHNEFSFKGVGREGEKDFGLAIFSFKTWDDYEKYRINAKSHPDCLKANDIVNKSNCFISYERNFVNSIF